jgi:hypothetical protein
MLYTKLTIVFDETPNTVFVWKRKIHHGYHGDFGTTNSLDQTLNGDQTHDNYPTFYIDIYEIILGIIIHNGYHNDQ